MPVFPPSSSVASLYWLPTATQETTDIQALVTTSLAGRKPRSDVLLTAPGFLTFADSTSHQLIGVAPFATGSGQGGTSGPASPAGLVLQCTFADIGSSLILFSTPASVP